MTPEPNPVQWAIIRLPPAGPERERIKADAIVWGDMASVTEPILSSLAREQTEQLLNDTAEAIEQSKAQAHELVARQDAHYRRVIGDLCDGVSRMAVKMDAFLTREQERQRNARAKARADLEASLPDPDTPPSNQPRGEYPAPSLEPSLRATDPGEYPDEDGMTYDKPAELPGDKPRSDQGHLPTELLPGAPPLVGTMPVWDPRELKHPQPIPPTQAAIGGS